MKRANTSNRCLLLTKNFPFCKLVLWLFYYYFLLSSTQTRKLKTPPATKGSNLYIYAFVHEKIKNKSHKNNKQVQKKKKGGRERKENSTRINWIARHNYPIEYQPASQEKKRERERTISTATVSFFPQAYGIINHHDYR